MKSISILLCAILLAACSSIQSPSHQQQAESLVKAYLDSTMNDPKSYQSVKFLKLDTLRSNPKDDPKYVAMENSYDSLLDESNANSKNIPLATTIPRLEYIKKRSNELYEKETALLLKESAFSLYYKGKQTGWSILHTFRGKNGFGALTLGTTKFYLDKNLTKVDSASKNQ